MVCVPVMTADRVVVEFKEQGLPTGKPMAGTDIHLAHHKCHISRLSVLVWMS